MGANKSLANGARFSNSRGTTWKYINWSRWHNNFGDSSVMLGTFPGDRVTRIFCMMSLAGRSTITDLVTMCIAFFVGAGRCHILLSPLLILLEHMVWNTGFWLIGRGPGLISTSPERSSSFEVFHMLLKIECEFHLWVSEIKMDDKCRSWIAEGICKWIDSE